MGKLINLEKKGNQSNGYLSYFEVNKNIPFTIKRIYYIYDVPFNKKRGMHAHKDLKQVLWCPYGSINITLDDGTDKKTYNLDSPHKILLVGKGIWRDMYWRKEGSVLCVAASEYYNENDYIRDYNIFLKHVKEGYWTNEDKI